MNQNGDLINILQFIPIQSPEPSLAAPLLSSPSQATTYAEAHGHGRLGTIQGHSGNTTGMVGANSGWQRPAEVSDEGENARGRDREGESQLSLKEPNSTVN